MSTVPCLIFILERISQRDLIPTCQALCSLTDLGEEIIHPLLDSGYLHQILEIILRNPEQFQETWIDDFFKNLFVFSPSSTLQTLFVSMNYLEILFATGHLHQSIVDALDSSLTVIDKLNEMNFIQHLLQFTCEESPESCYTCIASCTFLANESQLQSLVNQGILSFFSKCLQQSFQLEKTFKLMQGIIDVDSAYIDIIQMEAGVELNQLKLEKKNIKISKQAEEIIRQFPQNP
jgi:hypothetical protein